jgi:esterase/lipase superfamily enzyme
MAMEARGALTQFLDTLLKNPALHIEHVNIVVHSMGSRVLPQALDDFTRHYTPSEGRHVDFRLVIAAADTEWGQFNEAVNGFSALQPHVTVYTSNHDLALRVSRILHWFTRLGANSGPRVGDTNGDELLSCQPLRT